MMHSRIKYIFSSLLLLTVSFGAMSQMVVKGIVRDSLTLESLPYSSIRVDGFPNTAVADDRGLFEITLPEKARSFQVFCQGYTAKTMSVKNSAIQLYDVLLKPTVEELDEVVIKKQRYSKRNNPAVDFVHRLKDAGPKTDPRRNDWYSYDRYEQITLNLNDFDTTQQNGLLRKMPFLIEHVDTSEISGKPVLNLSVKEGVETVYNRRYPRSEKTVVHGVKSNGVYEFISEQNVQTILDDLLRDIDLYEGEIKLMRNNFVSPLSAVAPDFYRFYLVDSAATVAGSNEPHIALAFYPRNKESFGFKGHVYVPLGDSTMFIRRIEMETPKEINLNFVKTLKITQDYSKAPDGSRLKNSDKMLMELEVAPGTPQLYIARKVIYDKHNFTEPGNSEVIFGYLGNTITEDGANERDTTFWHQARRLEQQGGEQRIELLMKRLRQKPVFYWSEKILKILVNGYITTGKESKFDFGPMNTTASYNSLEGLRLRAGGMTTANLNPHLFGKGYVAYGFRDRKWKYFAQAEYSFNRKDYHSLEFPVHSIKIAHKYDVDRLGSHYLYTNSDNFVLSLTRQHDAKFTYRRNTSLVYTLELENNFSLTARAEQVREEASKYVKFTTGTGQAFSHYNQSLFGIVLRYAPGERFFQTRTGRISVNHEAPVFEISHTFSPKGLGGARFGLNRTEISVKKDFDLSFAGQLRTDFSGGHVWSTSPFPELFIPNANLSYTIQSSSFALMNPMEFINSSYVAVYASWHLRGLIFNRIPGFKKLKLREIVGFSGLYGHLSAKNTPGRNAELFAFPADCGVEQMKKPYMEVYVGLDNIFKIVRLDYVWRISYLDVPYAIDRHGLRVALHFTF